MNCLSELSRECGVQLKEVFLLFLHVHIYIMAIAVSESQLLSVRMTFREPRHHHQDLTTKEEQPIKASNTIEELKSKLGNNLDSLTAANMIPESQRGPTTHTEDGLIIPKKPPNPVKENSERQNLHKELMFNQKIGKNVLNQKSELQKALEKQKENRAKKEMECEMAKKAPEFQKVVQDRANRLEANKSDEKNDFDNKVINPAFLQARKNLKTRSDSK